MTSSERKLGGWRLGERLAETAHSIVWLGDRETGERAAIKELRVRRPEKEPYKRFRDEVAFHLERERPGVLPVLEAHVPDRLGKRESAWLAMPVARTLRDALGEAPSLEQVVEAVGVCARTLAGLAAEGVFHRDLKPNNLFERGGSWLVGDFGLVTWPGKQALTEAGDKLGPAHFVAPEVIADPAVADPGPADVWSLAKTLWVLAVGQNYPPPGQLRFDQEATALRKNNRHERAYALEPMLEYATQLDPRRRSTMDVFASELEAWLAPDVERRSPESLDEVEARVRAITAPAARADEARLVRDREITLLFERLRDQGVGRLYDPMGRLGRVHIDHQSLILHGLGGGTGRRDVAETMAESFMLAPLSPHPVSLIADVAYELFPDGLVHLIAGIYVRAGQELPELLWLGKRDAPLGTQLALRAADELAKELIEHFGEGAARFAELLEQAEAAAQRSGQPLLEGVGDNYVFRTDPERAGVIDVLRKSDGSRDGLAAAWIGAALVEIRADGDRLHVRTERNQGWITRNYKGSWALSDAQPIAEQ